MSRRFAVFDIDGTIVRWQLYHAIADDLARQGVLAKQDYERVRQARMNWKRRTGEELFREYEKVLIEVFDASIAGLSETTLSKTADRVFDQYKDQVYTYSRDLIRDLKAKNYLLFAISGSPAIIVKKLADYYGFDDFAASDYEISGGKLTGAKDLSIGKKPELLSMLVASHSADKEASIGVGDSEGDIDMLEMVDQPIALNPSKQLFEHAKAKGWQIIVERKNVIYRLEPGNDGYRLKN